jgi:hypothetical protein
VLSGALLLHLIRREGPSVTGMRRNGGGGCGSPVVDSLDESVVAGLVGWGWGDSVAEESSTEVVE